MEHKSINYKITSDKDSNYVVIFTLENREKISLVVSKSIFEKKDIQELYKMAVSKPIIQ